MKRKSFFEYTVVSIFVSIPLLTSSIFAFVFLFCKNGSCTESPGQVLILPLMMMSVLVFIIAHILRYIDNKSLVYKLIVYSVIIFVPLVFSWRDIYVYIINPILVG